MGTAAREWPTIPRSCYLNKTHKYPITAYDCKSKVPEVRRMSPFKLGFNGEYENTAHRAPQSPGELNPKYAAYRIPYKLAGDVL